MNDIYDIFPFVIVAITTTIVYAIFNKTAAGQGRSLRQAFRRLLECVGAFTLFFAINLAVGVILISSIRSLTPRFIALYALQNLMLLVLSAFQGFIFQLWWKRD